ncbi:hypothetical protein [Burkholderia sp. MSMB1835]|uniref:hypothetical protein n=1 Tax=Burkholderia sp. MSMB1835 TaxID=1637876 RepID=UPI0012E37289|nr:hypothetical protein [Burkholderia sp. MSMB1835]
MPASERKMHRSGQRTASGIVELPGERLRLIALARCCRGRQDVGRLLPEMTRDGARVAKRKPMRALSLQRMSADEIVVILHLFDMAFNDAGQARARQAAAHISRCL